MKIKVVLGLADCSNAQVLVKGDDYTTCMTGNLRFAAIPIVEQVTKTKTSITDLRATLNAPPSNTRTDNIRTARDTVDRNITILGSKVEEVANDPSVADSERLEIVHSAGMDAKDQAHRSKLSFIVADTEISGTVHLTAKGGANAHEWQYTSDVINFTGRIAAPSNTEAKINIANLKKGTEYAFFHKAIVPKTDTNWEGPIIWLVG
jgi:hypothetical protein